MTLVWNQGRADIEQLLDAGRLTRVTASRELADQYLESARRHLASARSLAESDPEGAFQLAYDCARKSLAAILLNQGLRASGEGAHATIQQAVAAQLGGSDLIRDRFGWLRRERNLNEYPTADAKLADSADAVDAIAIAGEILTKSAQALDLMPPFVIGA